MNVLFAITQIYMQDKFKGLKNIFELYLKIDCKYLRNNVLLPIIKDKFPRDKSFQVKIEDEVRGADLFRTEGRLKKDKGIYTVQDLLLLEKAVIIT